MTGRNDNLEEIVKEEIKKLSSNFELDILRLIKTRSMISLIKDVVKQEVKFLQTSSKNLVDKLDDLNLQITKLDSSAIGESENISSQIDSIKKLVDDYNNQFSRLRDEISRSSSDSLERIEALHKFYSAELEAFQNQVDTRIKDVHLDLEAELKKTVPGGESAASNREHVESSVRKDEYDETDAREESILDKSYAPPLILLILFLITVSFFYFLIFSNSPNFINDFMDKKAPTKEQSALEKKEREQIVSQSIEVKEEILPGEKVASQPFERSIPKEISEVDKIKEFYVVKARAANIRNGPGKIFEDLGTVFNGDKVQSLGEIDGRWMRVKTDNGIEGWIARSLVKPAVQE